MVTATPTRAAEDIARRGDDVYECQLRSQLEPQFNGQVVAIDVDSGAHAIGANALDAAHTLRASHPDAVIWLVRIGQRVLYRIGSGTQRVTK